MRGYAFTAEDGTGLFDGARWSAPSGAAPGAWTEASPRSPLRGRVRAHRASELPYWIDDALWVVELEGDVWREERLTSAVRGRLMRRVERWDEACAAEFTRACDVRAAGRVAAAPPGDDAGLMRGYMDDLRLYVEGAFSPASAAGTAAYIGARIAGIAAGPDRFAQGAARERALQGLWLAHRLGLPDTPAG